MSEGGGDAQGARGVGEEKAEEDPRSSRMLSLPDLRRLGLPEMELPAFMSACSSARFASYSIRDTLAPPGLLQLFGGRSLLTGSRTCVYVCVRVSVCV